MNYIQRIRDLREDNDMKQSEIANILQISQQQYSIYESGKRPIPVNAIIKLCKFYDVTADYFLCLIDEPRRIPRK